MYKVYVIQNNHSFEMYIGRTNDLERRLSEHNAGQQEATRRKSGEWVLIYAEAYRDKKDAIQRELRLKNHGRAKQELYKRIPNSLLSNPESGAGRSD